MVSCTEFIPLYSELFKYIEDKDSHDAVVRYWNELSEKYLQNSLGARVAEKGMAGCWDYWAPPLNEEAADFRMEYDDEENTFFIDMRHCPSAGLLNSMEHMEPYHDYCGHCGYLYPPVLKEYGILEKTDDCYVDQENSRCKLSFYLPKE